MSSILGNLRLSSFAATAIKGSLAAAILGLLVSKSIFYLMANLEKNRSL